jgi:hypothetical protein
MELRFTMQPGTAEMRGPITLTCEAEEMPIDDLMQKVDATLYEVVKARKRLCGEQNTTSERVDELIAFYRQHPPS